METRASTKQSEAEAAQANIVLEVIEQGFVHSQASIQAPFSTKVAIDGNGFRKNGLPGWASLNVRLEIKNLGLETGELIWEFDRSHTRLPPLFSLDKAANGAFDGLSDVEARQSYSIEYRFNVEIAEAYQDTHNFAKALKSLDKYCVAIKYQTKSVLGLSEPKILKIAGDFHNFRQQILNYWKRSPNFTELVGIVEQG